MNSQQSHFRFLCSFVFIFFFAQAMAISLLAPGCAAACN